MKFFATATFVLALAMGVQSSLIAGLPALSWGGHDAAIAAHGAPLWGHGIPAAINIAASPALHAGPIIAAAPALHSLAAHIPAAVAVAPHAAHVAHAAALPVLGATYVAKNRGAVHTAPLPGHIQSAASVNVAPAPGTW